MINFRVNMQNLLPLLVLLSPFGVESKLDQGLCPKRSFLANTGECLLPTDFEGTFAEAAHLCHSIGGTLPTPVAHVPRRVLHPAKLFGKKPWVGAVTLEYGPNSTYYGADGKPVALEGLGKFSQK